MFLQIIVGCLFNATFRIVESESFQEIVKFVLHGNSLEEYLRRMYTGSLSLKCRCCGNLVLQASKGYLSMIVF